MDEHDDSKKRAGEKPKYPPFRQEKKKLNGKVPVAKRDSKGHLYIVAEYNDTMKGKVIPDNQAVRAKNGQWFTKNEVDNFELKSTPRCPMYGVCRHCFSSGPVHMHCQKCKTKGHRYYIPRMNGVCGKILDAEWISRFFGTSHLDVRVCRGWMDCNTTVQIRLGASHFHGYTKTLNHFISSHSNHVHTNHQLVNSCCNDHHECFGLFTQFH
jgi:hypothetical protein